MIKKINKTYTLSLSELASLDTSWEAPNLSEVKDYKFLTIPEDLSDHCVIVCKSISLVEKTLAENPSLATSLLWIVSKGSIPLMPKDVSWAAVDSTDLYFCRLTEFIYHKKLRLQESSQASFNEHYPHAYVSRDAVIGKNVVILPGVYVGSDCVIADETILYPHVTIYPRVSVGSHCRIHSGVVIGADGFGYHFHQGKHHKIWHFGGVEIGDHVEIGAGTCIDAGTIRATIIQSGTIIDNQVQVAHNCHVGPLAVLCGQSGMAGSSEVGTGVVFGGRAALAPQCKVGSGSQVAGGAMITKSWPAMSQLAGHPARLLKDWMKMQAFLQKIFKQDKQA
jgi:UDP-3-O-[3-hydroxymyristoyl] glucosamine N-acyltransferase LpxD